MRPVVFTQHARTRMRERGTNEVDVERAIRLGEREPAQRNLVMYRLNIEFHREWGGHHYSIQQVAPIVAEEENRIVVVTVLTFYFEAGTQ